MAEVKHGVSRSPAPHLKYPIVASGGHTVETVGKLKKRMGIILLERRWYIEGNRDCFQTLEEIGTTCASPVQA